METISQQSQITSQKWICNKFEKFWRQVGPLWNKWNNKDYFETYPVHLGLIWGFDQIKNIMHHVRHFVSPSFSGFKGFSPLHSEQTVYVFEVLICFFSTIVSNQTVHCNVDEIFNQVIMDPSAQTWSSFLLKIKQSLLKITYPHRTNPRFRNEKSRDSPENRIEIKQFRESFIWNRFWWKLVWWIPRCRLRRTHRWWLSSDFKGRHRHPSKPQERARRGFEILPRIRTEMGLWKNCRCFLCVASYSGISLGDW